MSSEISCLRFCVQCTFNVILLVYSDDATGTEWSVQLSPGERLIKCGFTEAPK